MEKPNDAAFYLEFHAVLGANYAWQMHMYLDGVPEGMLDEYEAYIASATMDFFKSRAMLSADSKLVWNARRSEAERGSEE